MRAAPPPVVRPSPATPDVGDRLEEADALEIGLLNFSSKADFVDWLCPVQPVESAVPVEVQPLLREFADVFPSTLPPGYRPSY